MINKRFYQKNENFDKLYKQIYTETHKELFDSLKPVRRKILILIIIFLIINISVPSFSTIFLSFLCIFLPILLLLKNNRKEYRFLYKTKVIKPFLQQYDSSLNYEPDKGIPSTVYNEAFFENYKIYSSKDFIHGKLNGNYFQMAKIDTENKYIHSNNSVQYVSIFSGFFIVSPLRNNFNGIIKIRTNKNTFKIKNKLEMDSQEFEKYFDVITTNKIQALQVLTSELMNKLINFTTNYNIKLELTIKNNRIFIRFHNNTFFEPPFFSIFSVIKYNLLLKDYNFINFILDISKELIKATTETKI